MLVGPFLTSAVSEELLFSIYDLGRKFAFRNWKTSFKIEMLKTETGSPDENGSKESEIFVESKSKIWDYRSRCDWKAPRRAFGKTHSKCLACCDRRLVRGRG